MSDAKKSLIGALVSMATNLGDAVTVPVSDALRALDALLAEHRAEVEHLRGDAAESRELVYEMRSERDAAWDAGLEEAGSSVLEAVLLWVPDNHRAHARTAARRAIRAMKDKAPEPAVPLSKVREEAVRALSNGQSEEWRRGVAALADAVGVNVDDVLGDAEPAKTCPYCHEGHSRLTSCWRTEGDHD